MVPKEGNGEKKGERDSGQKKDLSDRTVDLGKWLALSAGRLGRYFRGSQKRSPGDTSRRGLQEREKEKHRNLIKGRQEKINETLTKTKSL